MRKHLFIGLVAGIIFGSVYNFATQSSSRNQMEPPKHSEIESNTSDNDEAEIDVMAESDEEKVGLNRGNIAPDFEITTLTGETVKLSDYRGERVMLNFWASWCGPCRTEMPAMQKFYEEKDVTILAVNVTDSELSTNNVTEFIEELELSFPILMDEEGKVSDLYRIKPIPTTYFINSDGLVHNVAFGTINYDLMVQEFEKMD
ncbi:peroxiredoxin family protein [Ornithinibacillus salinisoli]|uniref:Peroxiredoxin family protein n=1 Tax=Ornithinibacillus salinisoli TaxID=1848459 RepID=A0ABW4W145_9BACI